MAVGDGKMVAARPDWGDAEEKKGLRGGVHMSGIGVRKSLR
jgi:hypothetical protein